MKCLLSLHCVISIIFSSSVSSFGLECLRGERVYVRCTSTYCIYCLTATFISFYLSYTTDFLCVFSSCRVCWAFQKFWCHSLLLSPKQVISAWIQNFLQRNVRGMQVDSKEWIANSNFWRKKKHKNSNLIWLKLVESAPNRKSFSTKQVWIGFPSELGNFQICDKKKVRATNSVSFFNTHYTHIHARSSFWTANTKPSEVRESQQAHNSKKNMTKRKIYSLRTSTKPERRGR